MRMCLDKSTEDIRYVQADVHLSVSYMGFFVLRWKVPPDQQCSTAVNLWTEVMVTFFIWLTVTIVFLLRSINGSICLQLQVETLSTVQLRHDPLQLGLCGGEGPERDRRGKTQEWDHTQMITYLEQRDVTLCKGTFGSFSFNVLLVAISWNHKIQFSEREAGLSRAGVGGGEQQHQLIDWLMGWDTCQSSCDPRSCQTNEIHRDMAFWKIILTDSCIFKCSFKCRIWLRHFPH